MPNSVVLPSGSDASPPAQSRLQSGIAHIPRGFDWYVWLNGMRVAAARADAAASDELLEAFRAAVQDRPPGWHTAAASAVCVLSEVVFGASPAWSGASAPDRRLACCDWCARD